MAYLGLITLEFLMFSAILWTRGASPNNDRNRSNVSEPLSRQSSSLSFSKRVYSFEVREDTQPGTIVGRLEVVHEGLSSLVYSVLEDDGDRLFLLSPNSGEFLLSRTLDYEVEQFYILTAAAHLREQQLSRVRVYFNVGDVNDNPPVFRLETHSVSLPEDSPVGSCFFNLQVTDADEGINGEVDITVLSGDPEGMFSVNPQGRLCLNGELDRERRPMFSLLLQANDRALPEHARLSSTVRVSVHVDDINDNAPVFVSEQTISCPEDLALHSVVMVIRAVDADSGSNGDVVYSLQSSRGDSFRISQTGVVYLQKLLDRELEDEMVITIRARDKGLPELASLMNLTVLVEDVNDHEPKFSQTSYDVVLSEDAPPGTNLLTVQADDPDTGSYGEIRYQISESAFVVDPVLGVVTLTSHLDRERRSFYSISINAVDKADVPRSSMSTVNITLLDVNDCVPVFSPEHLTLHILENEEPSQTTYQVTASDEDDGPNSLLSYYMENEISQGKFMLHPNGTFRVLQSLDREEQSQHLLKIIAIDAGLPPLTGTGTILVLVDDVNDNRPVFDKDELRIQFISEDAPIGTTFGRIPASDHDAGANGHISYSLDGPTAPFSINATSGELFSTGPLDREDIASYILSVVARDGNPSHPLSSSVAVQVNVGDVNDHAPQFLYGPYVANAPAQLANGSLVCALTAKDRDDRKNGHLKFSLYGEHAHLFTVDSEMGTVFTTAAFNGIRDITIRGRVQDGGDPPRIGVTTLTVRFHNTSDFPRLSVHVFNESLYEDTPPGTVVALATSQTYRIGPVSFYLAGNAGDVFEINERTGKMTLRTSLDFERNKDFQMTIEARDAGSPPFATFSQIYLKVVDVNDNPPMFTKSEYRCEVFENVPESWVCDVSATDADSQEYGQVLYRIVSGNHKGAFKIDETYGILETMRSLDREDVPEHKLIVKAIDKNNRSLTSTALVTVLVTDTNDHAPRFSEIFFAEIPEDSPVGSQVILITAVDEDVGVNAVVSYAILDQTEQIPFSIDKNSGAIVVKGRLDREHQDWYIVRVSANDSDWTVSTDVTIGITDVNDNTPVFSQPMYSVTVPVTQDIHISLLKVTATDRDLAQNGQILYFIVPPSETFFVNASTGDISTKQRIVLDKSGPQILLKSICVMAVDCGAIPLNNSATVEITLVRYNYFPPSFLPFKRFLSLPFTLTLGTEVLQVEALDPDFPNDNVSIEYFISGGNASTYFHIDLYFGTVLLSRSLDQNFILRLEVTATDKGIPRLSSKTDIKVEVTLENVFAPQFLVNHISFSVPENLPVGSVVGKVKATDQDYGVNGLISYSFKAGNTNNNIFIVGLSSGLIELVKPLDFEKAKFHHVLILAKDGAWFPKTGTINVTINVTDVNDNPPVFTYEQYLSTIAENAEIGSTVIQIRATDEDFGSNAQAIYSLISGRTDLFFLDADKGTVTSLAMFDYEQQHRFELTVKASDADNPNLYDVAHAIVQVTDMNEYTPTFQAHVYNFSVAENVPIRTEVGQVLAVDHDLGPSGQVFYLVFGPGKEVGFAVDERSGKIYTSKDLKNRDRNHATLRILAKNEGSIAGFDVDEALIHVHIIDENDAPEFESGLYTALVREDATLGTSITKVRASDEDLVVEWGRFFYGLSSGNVNHSFSIDPVTGIITVANQLDREIWPRYDITVIAIDEGSPPVTGSTSVIVTVIDINDNAPTLTPTEAFVRENQPSGALVATLTAIDEDLPPNQGPFTFWLMRPTAGNSFTLTSDGVLFTSRPLDREVNFLFDIHIVIQDAGTPRLSSTTLFQVKVLDENDNPPVPRDINILVKYYGTFFPGGLIGNVKPDDLDELDVFNCSVKGGHNTMFSFPFGMCNLWSSPYHGEATHNLTVEASDNFHPSVNNSIYVNYKGFTNVSLDNCVLFYVSFSNLENFLSLKYLRFAKALDSLFNLQASKSHVFGMKLQQNEMLLLAAMKSYNGLYLSGDVASQISRMHKRLLEMQTDVTITQITSDPCSTKPCHNGATCNKNIQVSQEVDVVQSSRLIFVSPQYQDVFNCTCPAGFTGITCELDVDECLENPCENGGSCYNNPGGFLCRCSDGFSGLHCNVADNECQKVICSNGGTCWNIQGGFFCDCRPGYEGRFCDFNIDHCASSPCLHGRCSNSFTGYTCHCSFGVTGVNCEAHSYGFEELSYMEFPSLDPRYNFISLEVATVKQNSLLLYNPGEPLTFTASALRSTSEFLALEIVYGKLRLSYDLGSGVVRLETAKLVADGSFHNVTVRRIGNIASLEVDNCTVDEPKGLCLARHEGIGTQRTLDVRSNNLTFGGVKSMDVIFQRPSQVWTHDFVGCVRNVKVNDILLDASKALDANKIIDRCPRADIAPCSGAPCLNGGVCQDHWSYHFCQCTEGFTGPTCAQKEHALFLREGKYVEFVLKESYVRTQQLQFVLGEKDGEFEGIISLEIKMKMIQQDSMIMFGQSESIKIKLKIHDGKPLYIFTHLLFGQWELSTDMRVSDGQWHILRLSRNGPSIVLLLDEQPVRNITSSILNQAAFTVQTIMLGSAPPGESDFVGCVEYIRLNGHTLPFSGHSEIVEAKPSPSLFQADCVSSDHCPLTTCFEESCPQLSCWPNDDCISAIPEDSWCVCGQNSSESEACQQTRQSTPLWIIAAVFPASLIAIILIFCLVFRRQGKFWRVRHTSRGAPPKVHGTDNIGFSLDHGDGVPQDVSCKNIKRPDLIVAGEQSFRPSYLTGFEGSERETDSDIKQIKLDIHGVNAGPWRKASAPKTGNAQASNFNPTFEQLSKIKLISDLSRPSSFLSDDEIKRLSIILGKNKGAGSSSESYSSFTCSEFGYEKELGGWDGKQSRPSEGGKHVLSVFREVQTPSDGSSPVAIHQWESLLNLGVHFSTYSDVFEDIAKLPDIQTCDCDIYSDEEQII